MRLPHKLLCYVMFSIFCIMGTYFGLHIRGLHRQYPGHWRGTGRFARRAGGWRCWSGLTGGLHRYSLGGMTALSCMISTIIEGLLGGLVHRVLMRRGRIDRLFNPLTVAGVTLFAELLQMGDHFDGCASF